MAAGAWLLPSSGPLGSLRKLEIGEACGAASVSWLLIAAPAVGKGLAVVMFDSDGLLVNLQ